MSSPPFRNCPADPVHPRRRHAFLALASAVRVPLAMAMTWSLLAWSSFDVNDVHACGPMFPNRMLSEGRDGLASAPVASFKSELIRLLDADKPRWRSVPPGKSQDRYDQTVEAGINDLKDALSSRRIAGLQQRALLAAYERYRAGAGDIYRQQQNPWRNHNEDPDREQGNAKTTNARLDPSLDALPAEFLTYLQGAAAWRNRDMPAARSAWNTVLAMPAAQRKYRSVWAAYMIGRAYQEEHEPEKAIAAFQLTRSLVNAGFRDSLGLAAASLGWEAKAELSRQHLSRAIELYATQYRSGDENAIGSIRTACMLLLRQDDAELHAAAERRDVIHAMSAYLLSDGFTGWSYGHVTHEHRKRWLDALASAGRDDVAGADRLAWMAYQAGDMERAAGWVERAADDAPMTHWLRAKLAMRAGRVNDAIDELAQAARMFPADQAWEYTSWQTRTIAGWDAVEPRSEVLGEAGALLLGRGEYVRSLDALLASGKYWEDAAYVAEQVLTLDELKQYVTTVHMVEDADPAADNPSAAGSFASRAVDSTASSDIRNLLARRLVRAGRWRDALPIFTEPSSRDLLKRYVESIRAGHDGSSTSAERASAFFEAAKLARHEGMTLLATDLAPDFAIYCGNFEHGMSIAARSRADDGWAAATDDEASRATMPTAKPMTRFHYRYVAVDHAWTAAALMPDNSPQLVDTLWTAGQWLAARDPDAADRFYKALVLRCGDTDVGRDANRRRWFPPETLIQAYRAAH